MESFEFSAQALRYGSLNLGYIRYQGAAAAALQV